jgi:hypothetical protein
VLYKLNSNTRLHIVWFERRKYVNHTMCNLVLGQSVRPVRGLNDEHVCIIHVAVIRAFCPHCCVLLRDQPELAAYATAYLVTINVIQRHRLHCMEQQVSLGIAVCVDSCKVLKIQLFLAGAR